MERENKHSFFLWEQARAHSCLLRRYELFKTLQSVSLRCLISLSDLVTWLEKLKLRVTFSCCSCVVLYTDRLVYVYLKTVDQCCAVWLCSDFLQIFAIRHLAGVFCSKQRGSLSHRRLCLFVLPVSKMKRQIPIYEF